MTKQGYKTILVKEEIYEKIKEIAEKENLSIAKATSKIVSEYLENKN